MVYLHSFDFYCIKTTETPIIYFRFPFLALSICIKARIILYLPINLIYGKGLPYASLNEAENSFQIKYFTGFDSNGQCLWIQSH